MRGHVRVIKLLAYRKLRFAGDSPVEGGGFEPSVPGAKEPVSFAEGELRGIERGRPTKFVSLRGTDGSNPSPSSGESGANLTSSCSTPVTGGSSAAISAWHAPVTRKALSR